MTGGKVVATDAPEEPCDVFEWVGQSFRSCDACGRPFWEHHFRRPLGSEMTGGPFSQQEEEPIPLSHEERLSCLLGVGTAADQAALIKLP